MSFTVWVEFDHRPANSTWLQGSPNPQTFLLGSYFHVWWLLASPSHQSGRCNWGTWLCQRGQSRLRIWMILVDPFKLRIFYDSIIKFWPWMTNTDNFAVRSWKRTSWPGKYLLGWLNYFRTQFSLWLKIGKECSLPNNSVPFMCLSPSSLYTFCLSSNHFHRIVEFLWKSSSPAPWVT